MNTAAIISIVVSVIVLLVGLGVGMYFIFRKSQSGPSALDNMMRQLGAKVTTDSFSNTHTQNCDDFALNTIDNILDNPYCYINLMLKSNIGIDLGSLDQSDQTTIYNNITKLIYPPIREKDQIINNIQSLYKKLDPLIGGPFGISISILYPLININNDDKLRAFIAGFLIFQFRQTTLVNQYINKNNDGYIIYDKPNSLIKINTTGNETDNCIDFIEIFIQNNGKIDSIPDTGCIIFNLNLATQYMNFFLSSRDIYKLRDNHDLLVYIYKDLSDVIIYTLLNLKNTDPLTTTEKEFLNEQLSNKLTTLKPNKLYTDLSVDNQAIIDKLYTYTE